MLQQLNKVHLHMMSSTLHTRIAGGPAHAAALLRLNWYPGTKVHVLLLLKV
jgi:hypothetical protein